jgi:hypothetical protein
MVMSVFPLLEPPEPQPASASTAKATEAASATRLDRFIRTAPLLAWVVRRTRGFDRLLARSGSFRWTI